MPPHLRSLVPGVLVATSRRDHTNSVVITDPENPDQIKRALLVDPAWDPDELDLLASELFERGIVPVAGLSTHAHHDHLLWHPGFGDVPRWATVETVRRAAGDRAVLLRELGSGYRPEIIELFGALTPLRAPELIWEGPQIDLAFHDAHVPGHLAAWLADERVLIAGDMLSDIELPLLDDGPLALERYREGLEILQPFVAATALVIPGHGNPGSDAMARLDADRRYLDCLEAGREPDDRRLDDMAMLAAHALNVELVQ